MYSYKEILKLDNNNDFHNLFLEIVNSLIEENTKNSLFIYKVWLKYQEHISSDRNSDSKKNKNGAFFELLIQLVLCKENILPYYREAKLVFVPNVIFDIIIYTKDIGPICLS